MTQTVLVPGLFSCEMSDLMWGVIWPPGKTTRPMDSTTLVNRLIDPATRFGPVIERVQAPFCDEDIYGTIIAQLRLRGNFTAFSYDWRRDVRDAAAALAGVLDALPPDGDIHLVAHSMGGIIVRWLLESGRFSGDAWFSRVTLAVFVAVPHLGAPLALFRILGQDPIQSILVPNWATRILAGDPALWPSGYQLLPPSGIDCATMPNGTKKDMAEAFGDRLLSVGVAKMQEVQSVLERFDRPRGTSYVLAYGMGSPRTVSGVRVGTDGGAQEDPGDGDGTVPTWSAEPTKMVAAAAPAFDDVAMFIADHVGILGNRLFLARLTSWLNGTALLVASVEPQDLAA